MKITHTVGQILQRHTTLEVESIDRMYLNMCVGQLQREMGVVSFFRYHRNQPYVSSALMGPMTQAFIAGIDRYTKQTQTPVITFAKGERKDDVAARYLAKHDGGQKVLFIGKAQEKANLFRAEKRRNAHTGTSYPWIVRSTAMVNHYYFYCYDDDFGLFFIKYCSYFPYTGKVCLNGHHWAKRQLEKEGIGYEALDNGILSCEDPKRAREICDSLTGEKIQRLTDKWQGILPNPYTDEDRHAGFRYDLSILQAEFSLTQVLDRPQSGRLFFQEVIAQNLEVGMPGKVQLIFDRRVTRRTPGSFRTRVITKGVTPSLHAQYKHTQIKQYHKEGRALRTETTINDTRDFGIGKRLKNLPALRKVGFEANRRLLDVQQVRNDCFIGEEAFQRVQSPVVTDSGRASALRFADQRVQRLLIALIIMHLLPDGFRQKDMREQLAQLLAKDASQITAGRMTYELRRLRLHGFIERIPKRHRYRLTPFGLRASLFLTMTYSKVLCTGLSQLLGNQLATPPPGSSKLGDRFTTMQLAIERFCFEAQRAA